MYSLREKVMSFLLDEEGFTTVEYAVAGALISALIVLAFQGLSITVCQLIDNMNTSVLSAGTVTGGALGGC